MINQAENKNCSGRLVAIGCAYEPWIALLEQSGWKTHCCYDLRTVDQILEEFSPCICIADLSNNDFSLNSISMRANKTKQVKWIAIIKKEQLKVESICQFINNFCVDYFTTPIPSNHLISTVGHQLGMLQLESNMWSDAGTPQDIGLFGSSKSIKQLRDVVRRVAATDVNVFISGEQGTGKELIARTIHNTSKRRNENFTLINCASLDVDDEAIAFLKSELDAVTENTIKNGTVLFYGIEELSNSLQLLLLSYLQKPNHDTLNEKKLCDVRVITSSGINLLQSVEDGRFNKDLYYRLNVFNVTLPTLRERGSDIVALSEYFLRKFSKEYSTMAAYFSEEARQLLVSYNWPGNVRELINQIKRVSLLTDGQQVGVEHIDLPRKNNMKQSLKNIKDEAEKDVLVVVLETHQGQVASAAKDLGVSRATMYRLLSKHNIVPDVRYYNGGS